MGKGTVNKVILIGRLGADPETRYTPGGSAVANFNIATDRGWKDKDGNWQNETTWHRIVAWARLAEVAKEYLKKGHRVYIEGRIQNRSWEDQNGQKRYVSEVVANDLQMLEPAPGGRSGPEEPPETIPGGDEPPADSEEKPEDLPF